jgi:hypothetical protein
MALSTPDQRYAQIVRAFLLAAGRQQARARGPF